MESKVTEALRWIVGILERHNVPYQIAGGFAARLYGATRPINDIDIDIPRTGFDAILPDVQGFVTYGPGILRDEKWDMYALQLSYQGQEIDIGSEECNIFDDKAQVWVESNAHLAEAVDVPFNGRVLRVCPRQKLIDYKKLLKGEHQKQ